MDQRSDRTEFFFLQHAEQLGLQIQRQLANFIEKRGAAIGGFDQADLLAHRAGERAFHMSEQFALHERTHHRRAIDSDERPCWIDIMDRPGDYFLAGPCLAQQQNWPAAPAELLHHPQDVPDSWRLPY